MSIFLYLSRKRRDVHAVSCSLGLNSYDTENTSREGTWVTMTSTCYLCPIVIRMGLFRQSDVKIASRKSVVRNRAVPCHRDNAIIKLKRNQLDAHLF
jgi:hypothetical protein